jgi:nucleotide-binding universal stress UspA family protein
MTSDSASRRIVVGYDGSPASRAALTCAAARAGEDGRIYVVHAYSVPADYVGAPHYQQLLDAALDRARESVGRIEHESGADLAGVEWETEVIGDAPARAIVAVANARQADEIIVGTRGFGRARALFGSVAHELIHLADCPITVIPERVVDRHETRETTGAPS